MDPLALIAEEPSAAAIFLDVDGVLAPIVEHRDDARVPDETRVELERLARTYGLVAAVTGRSGEVARAIVGVPSLVYAGEHGLELHPEASAWTQRLADFAASAGWGETEVKPFSLAFHYRTAPDPVQAREELEAVQKAALELGLRARFGRMVLEVLPPIDASKGTAVRTLLEQSGLRRALYAGDDTTDLDGFAALDGLEAAVRIAVVSPDGPEELGRRADLILGSPAALAELLRRL